VITGSLLEVAPIWPGCDVMACALYRAFSLAAIEAMALAGLWSIPMWAAHRR